MISRPFSIKVDPYEKPKDLLEVSPRGLVPGLRLNDANPPRAVAESSIVMEYVDELAKSQGKPTLMPDDLCEEPDREYSSLRLYS